MQGNFITYKSSSIYYRLYGNGGKLIFCFHGYGEDNKSFDCLAEKLGRDYTLVAMDMPFHGETEWYEGLTFQPQELITIIHQIRQTLLPVNHPISQSTDQPITLLGFSMGGRIALQLLQLIPESIERCVLAAPDGLHKNPWYTFSTQTWIGNKIFKRVMYKPDRIFWLLDKAGKLKLAHPSIIKVAHYYLDDAQERIKLYCRWTTLRKFKPSLPLIKKLIAQYSIPVRFLFGRYDGIIVSDKADIFKSDTANVQVHIIEAGHRLMQDKYSDEIVKLFYQ